MSNSYDHQVDAAFHGRPLAELLAAPVDALSGVSAGDADHLRAAFGIRTVRDLGESRYCRRAAAMVDPIMNIWDAAALQPILEEAGGVFTNWRGEARIDSGEGLGTMWGRTYGAHGSSRRLHPI